MSLVFEEDVRPAQTAEGQLLLDLDGFGGPIDLLLQLARDKKIDLVQLSIARLAEQYIAFIDHARHLRLEIAADYLVMAAWLAYLKSRLLLPATESGEDEPTAEELAEALALQLQRLEAMQRAGARLMALPRLGEGRMARGMPETFAASGPVYFEVSLFDMLKAYAACRRKKEEPQRFHIPPLNLDSVEAALVRLAPFIGVSKNWKQLEAWLPALPSTPLERKASVAATFGAALELVKRGEINLRQDGLFGPIYLRGVDCHS